MRILISLMYYRPHYSGLTIYTERLARALAARGHQVTVLTSRYDRSLPVQERRDGVEIIRPWVLTRLTKGVIMPTLPYWAWQLIRRADVVNTHVPQPDAAVVGAISRYLNKPVVLTYHCDLQLPKGFLYYLANQYSHLANRLSASLADVIVTNTLDFAEHSEFLRRYLFKVCEIPPPVELPKVKFDDLAAFRVRSNIQPGQRIVGMVARLATEKGVEYLVEAFPSVLQKCPEARVLFAGQHQDVLGEEKYAQKLAPLINALGEHWTFLGILPPEQLAAFYQEAEVTVLPSINSTESFGMVQIESMISGTPVIAADLPGVRQPILGTGMGIIVQPENAQAISQALIKILDHPNGFGGDIETIGERYSPNTIATAYEAIFNKLTGKPACTE